MDIPASRKREFDAKEISLIGDAIRASGLDAASVPLTWEPHRVQLDNVVELLPVLFDCRGPLETRCWIVRRLAAQCAPEACSCGILVRESASGTYGSLRTAVASALAEVVRARVLDNIPDAGEVIPKARQMETASAAPNDFITDCIHT